MGRARRRVLGAVVALALALGVAGPVLADEAPGPIVAGGPPGATVPVAPPSGSPIASVGRDCGFSVELHNGSALWIYCDSSDATHVSEPTWFVNNTAALARTDSPTTMREPLEADGEPFPFIVPGTYDPCGARHHIIWPTSAVAIPGPSTTRVLVYFENLCGGPDDDITEIESRSMGVAEYVYDPASDPLSRPIRATILEPALWPSPAKYGHASVVSGGYVHVYQCRTQWGSPWGCTVGRVPLDAVADPSAYRWWNGTDYVQYRHNAAFMPMVGTDLPGAAYQVAFVAEWQAFVMTYIAWPGIGDEQKVRVAAQPQGPWSAPLTIDLPGCGVEPHLCYAGGIHTQLTTERTLGLTYFDPYVTFPDRPPAGQVRQYVQPVFPPFGDRWRFWDVPPEHRFHLAVEWAAAAGVAQGAADGLYHPTAAVSRQAMAAFLHRLAGSPAPQGSGSTTFRDVPPGHHFATEIAWLAAEGIAEGYPDGRFRPAAVVSRQAMAAFLHRLAGSPAVPAGAPGFVDVPADHPFAGEIAWLAAVGVTLGTDDGAFRPERPVSRQAMAAFLQRFAACCSAP